MPAVVMAEGLRQSAHRIFPLTPVRTMGSSLLSVSLAFLCRGEHNCLFVPGAGSVKVCCATERAQFVSCAR